MIVFWIEFVCCTQTENENTPTTGFNFTHQPPYLILFNPQERPKYISNTQEYDFTHEFGAFINDPTGRVEFSGSNTSIFSFFDVSPKCDGIFASTSRVSDFTFSSEKRRVGSLPPHFAIPEPRSQFCLFFSLYSDIIYILDVIALDGDNISLISASDKPKFITSTSKITGNATGPIGMTYMTGPNSGKRYFRIVTFQRGWEPQGKANQHSSANLLSTNQIYIRPHDQLFIPLKTEEIPSQKLIPDAIDNDAQDGQPNLAIFWIFGFCVLMVACIGYFVYIQRIRRNDEDPLLFPVQLMDENDDGTIVGPAPLTIGTRFESTQ